MFKNIFFLVILLFSFNAYANKKYDYTIYIGRFQPIHNGHIKVIDEAMLVSDKIIIICGSIDKFNTEKNPLSFDQRKMLIESVIESKYSGRYHIIGVKDMPKESDWNKGILSQVNNISGNSKNIAIIGHFKDDSSYYLKNFPMWGLVTVDNHMNINATDIRKAITKGNMEAVKDLLPSNVLDYMINYYTNSQIK